MASLEAGSVDGAIAITSMTFPDAPLLGVTNGECEASVEGHAMLMRGDGERAVLGAEVRACGSWFGLSIPPHEV